MSSNPATLAASRAMLTRNHSSQSNLSAAAAAAALKRASSQTQIDRQSSTAALAAAGFPPSNDAQTSPRPGLRRRTSSMSERSFRSQTPADHAKERRERPASMVDTTPEKKDKGVKRRGSFTLPSLRGSSLKKSTSAVAAANTAPGLIQPLPQQTQQPVQTQTQMQTQRKQAKPQHKLKTSLRGSGGAAERDSRPMSPPTHSAMRLPHPPGIGSSSSSIRSFQTDLSSIAEDQMIDYSNIPLNTKGPSHLYPIKSAMKGGSGPPSIISEAISEESRSSLGTQDRKAKARVSFSDEQEMSGQQIMQLGQAQKGKDGFLKPENAALLGKTTQQSAGEAKRVGSPPLSPPLSPQLSVTMPSKSAARTSILSGNVQSNSEGPSSLTPASTLQGSPLPRVSTPPSSSQSKEVTQPLKITPAPIPVLEKPTPVTAPAPQSKEPTSTLPSQRFPSPIPQTAPSAPVVANDITPIVPQVTIRVPPPTPSLPPSRLPGSFPDPTPDPTPPGTSADQDTAAEAHERTDTLSPLPIRPITTPDRNTPTPDLNSDLDLQRGLSMRTMNLIPTSPKVTTPKGGNQGRFVTPGSPEMVRRISNESAGSGTSVYSDAVDDLTDRERGTPKRDGKEWTGGRHVNGDGTDTGREGLRENALVSAWDPVVKEKGISEPIASVTKSAPTSVATATTATAVTAAPVVMQPTTQKEVHPSKPPGTTIPLSIPLTSSVPKSPLRTQNGNPKTLRTSSVPPSSTSPPVITTTTTTVISPQNRTSMPPTTTTPKRTSATPTSLRTSSVPPTTTMRATSPTSQDRKPMRMSLRQAQTGTSTTSNSPSVDMARGLMSLPRIERVPSDSSFKRMKPKGDSGFAKTLRSPKNTERAPPRRRGSSSSDDTMATGTRGGFFSRLRRGSNSEKPSAARPAFVSSRFGDSSDEEDIPSPPPVVVRTPAPQPRRLESSMTAPVASTTSNFNNIGGTGATGSRPSGYTESLPPSSPVVKKRSSFSQLFKRHGRRDSKLSITQPDNMTGTGVGTPSLAPTDVSGHQRSKSASIYSKRTGKEKRFQGLRKLFRIKE